MDLIYTNSARVDQGVLQDYELDLAFGADENNLECKVQAGSHCCESGSLLYMEGTEYGGIIDSIESDTDSKEVIYTGRTWHGILNSKVIQPDSGAAYLVLTGEANAVIADLLSRLALTDLFAASSEDSGLNIKNYKMNRYISGYDGIRKMLGTVGGKLNLTFSDGKVVLSAAAAHDYTQDEEFDADQVPFRAKRNYKGVNHLICLGSGQLEARMVVHLYADTEGNISQTQTQFGLDEVCTIYEYSNVETEEELVQEGMDQFKSLMAEDEIAIDFDADSDTYDVGDIIGAVDNITGLAAHTTIAKKIVTIKNGKITISLTPDKAKEGSSYEGGGNSGGESIDAYTKAETLSSEVKTMLGLVNESTPSDAFKALKVMMFCPQIVVTAPTGSAVTCKKGDTILTVEEVNGTWTFNLTEYGEWVIVFNGKEKKSVVVDSVKSYAVTIITQLVNYTMLYDFGDECEEITGGWVTDGYPSGGWSVKAATKNVDNIFTAGTSPSSTTNNFLGTANGIDTTGYNGVFALAKNVGTDGEYPWLHMFVGSKTSTQIGCTFSATGTQWVYRNNLDSSIRDQKNWKDNSDFSREAVYFRVFSQYSANRKANWYAVFITKEDSWRSLCEIAGVTAPSNVVSFVADSYAVTKILNNADAVEHMVCSCTGDFMAHAIQSSVFLSALESSPYKEQVYANEHWAKFLAMVA